ncbi:DUF1007 family protein [bacterium]|nr:DUF1007 family protein [bacterium]
MKIRKNFCRAIILCFLFVSDYVAAHPHVFIDNEITIVFNQEGLAGIKIKWFFDEMFSSMIIHDYDENKNGVFDSVEIEAIKNGAFSNLRKFNYFTRIKIDGKPFIVESAENFSVSKEDDCVVYNFFIPCKAEAEICHKEVKISVYDDSYYVDILKLDRDVIQFKGNDLIEYEYELRDDTGNPYYFGQIFPQEMILKFKKKNEQKINNIN